MENVWCLSEAESSRGKRRASGYRTSFSIASQLPYKVTVVIFYRQAVQSRQKLEETHHGTNEPAESIAVHVGNEVTARNQGVGNSIIRAIASGSVQWRLKNFVCFLPGSVMCH
jgi:hypothetical protein